MQIWFVYKLSQLPIWIVYRAASSWLWEPRGWGEIQVGCEEEDTHFPPMREHFHRRQQFPLTCKVTESENLKANGRPHILERSKVKGLEVRSRMWGPQNLVLQNSKTNSFLAPPPTILEHSLKRGVPLSNRVLNANSYLPPFSVTSTLGHSKNLPGVLVSTPATTSHPAARVTLHNYVTTDNPQRQRPDW